MAWNYTTPNPALVAQTGAGYQSIGNSINNLGQTLLNLNKEIDARKYRDKYQAPYLQSQTDANNARSHYTNQQTSLSQALQPHMVDDALNKANIGRIQANNLQNKINAELANMHAKTLNTNASTEGARLNNLFNQESLIPRIESQKAQNTINQINAATAQDAQSQQKAALDAQEILFNPDRLKNLHPAIKQQLESLPIEERQNFLTLMLYNASKNKPTWTPHNIQQAQQKNTNAIPSLGLLQQAFKYFRKEP